MRTIWASQKSKSSSDGLTLTELLVSLAVLAIIAALAFPILNDITISSRNSALDRQREVVADFIDQYGSGSFANADGTGPDAGYRVGFPDYDGDRVQDANEPTVSRIGLDEYNEYILWQEGLNGSTGNLILDYATGSAGQSLLPVITGAVGDVTYSVESGALPEGVTLNPNTGAINAPYDLTTELGSVAVPAEVDLIERMADNSLVVSGEFKGTITFSGLPSIQAESTGWVSYVARLNPNNTWAWATAVPGTLSDIRALEISSTGTVLVAGSISGPTTIAGTAFSATSESFVAMLATNGSWEWAVNVNAEVAGLAPTSDGGAVIGGVLYDPALHPGAPSAANFGATTLAVTGERTAIMAKIGSSGAWQWARQAGGSDYSHIDEVVVGGNTAYYAMHARGVVTFGTTTIDSGMPSVGYQANGEIVIVRLNTSTGATVGITRTPTVSVDEWAAMPYTTRLAVSPDGGLLLAGESGGAAMTFGSTSLSDPGEFVAKMSAAGTWQWGKGSTAGPDSWIYGLTANTDGGASITMALSADTFTAGTSSVTTVDTAAIYARISPAGVWEDVDLIAEGPILRGYGTVLTSTGFAMGGRADHAYTLGGRTVPSPTGVRTGWIARLRSDGSALPVVTMATVTIRATDANGKSVSKTITFGF